MKSVLQINGEKTINVDVSVKKRHVCIKDYIWNPATYSSENGKYLTSIIDDSVITYDEVIELYNKETKTVSTTFTEKKSTLNLKLSIFYLHFY